MHSRPPTPGPNAFATAGTRPPTASTVAAYRCVATPESPSKLRSQGTRQSDGSPMLRHGRACTRPPGGRFVGCWAPVHQHLLPITSTTPRRDWQSHAEYRFERKQRGMTRPPLSRQSADNPRLFAVPITKRAVTKTVRGGRRAQTRSRYRHWEGGGGLNNGNRHIHEDSCTA